MVRRLFGPKPLWPISDLSAAFAFGVQIGMNIQVSGKQIDVGQALATHVRERLSDRLGKIYDRASSAAVTFSRDGYGFRADCIVHLSSGVTLKTHGTASEIYPSFDQAALRLEKRLRRYKRRLRDHHHGERNDEALATSYVIAQEAEDAEEPQGDAPTIVAEQATQIPTLTVGEAVMRLDLSESVVLVFHNRAHGGLNIVYRRGDGHIGWIDPKDADASEPA
jgi:ribosomal subunit interface protein